MSKQYNISEQSEEQQKTRERIIAAASKVLAEKGYDATTLREISREAQAAPGLVHYYFGGKDQLLVEVLEASGRRFSQETEQLVQHVPADQSLDMVMTTCEDVDGVHVHQTDGPAGYPLGPATSPLSVVAFAKPALKLTDDPDRAVRSSKLSFGGGAW